MTPCEERGYYVGDLFEVVERSGLFGFGAIISLDRDDGTVIPRFKLVQGKGIMECAWISLHKIQPLSLNESSKYGGGL